MDVKSGSKSKHCRTVKYIYFLFCFNAKQITSGRFDTIWDWLNAGKMFDFWVYYAFKFLCLHGHCWVSSSGSQTCFVNWLRETEADLSPSCLRNKEWPGTGQNLINSQSCNRAHYLILKSLWRLYKTVQVCLRAQVSFCPFVLWVSRCNTVPTSAVVWKKRVWPHSWAQWVYHVPLPNPWPPRRPSKTGWVYVWEEERSQGHGLGLH